MGLKVIFCALIGGLSSVLHAEDVAPLQVPDKWEPSHPQNGKRVQAVLEVPYVIPDGPRFKHPKTGQLVYLHGAMLHAGQLVYFNGTVLHGGSAVKNVKVPISPLVISFYTTNIPPAKVVLRVTGVLRISDTKHDTKAEKKSFYPVEILADEWERCDDSAKGPNLKQGVTSRPPTNEVTNTTANPSTNTAPEK